MKLLLFVLAGAFPLLFGTKRPGGVPGEEKKAETLIEFRIDKRIESCYIVFLLTGKYPVMTPFANEYKTDALAYFSKHKNHKAVWLADYLVQRKFYADYAVSWMLQHSDFPDFNKNYAINFPFEGRQLNADTLELFREEMINFYKDADCEQFFTAQQNFLEKMVASVRSDLTRQDLVKIIEDYFGEKKEAGYTVILSPLVHSGGFAVERTDKNELFAVIGPGGVQEGFPQFEKVYLEQDMIIHEFSHNYANPVTEKFMKKTRKFEAKLFPPVKEAVTNEGYADWESFITELIVRATTLRIVERTYGREAAEELLEYENYVGFIYVRDIADELKIYEAQRKKYPGFEHFYPQIVKRLGRIRP